MSDRRQDDEMPFEALSALADGEASAPEVARACSAWREDAKVRAQWSSYHLIGDAMRSDELADASGSAHFLKSFRERLAQEPVVLAPAGLVARHQPSVVDVGASTQPVAAPALRRRVWAGPMAVAACFVMVVGALVTSQGGLTGGASPAGDNLAQGMMSVQGGGMAQALAPSSLASWSGHGVTAASLAEGASFTPVDGDPVASAGANVWRDPQLDLALSAVKHGQAGEQSFASHGGLARNVLYESP
jgi:sigma-E factor negative regulatory protein RseA